MSGRPPPCRPAASTGSTPQIIGGHPTPIGAYPFQAALIDLTRAGSDYDRQICGGTLIAPTWVLTAAHCVTEGGVTTTPAQLKIGLGRTSLTSHNGESNTVKTIYWRARYRGATDADDVALVKLTTPSAYGPIAVQPARQVPVVSDRVCKDAYAAVGDVIVASRTVCARATGLDACYGDSGGPMFTTTPSGPVQVGIVASDEGCGATGFPGTYTEVNARTFISSTMARVS